MKMENTNKKLTEEIQEEKDLILDKALDEMWERGFKYGVAWLLKQTEKFKINRRGRRPRRPTE